MVINLQFDKSHRYKESIEGIPVPVSLTAGGKAVHTDAKIDCGSAACLFSNEIGMMLGLNIEEYDFVTTTRRTTRNGEHRPTR